MKAALDSEASSFVLRRAPVCVRLFLFFPPYFLDGEPVVPSGMMCSGTTEHKATAFGISITGEQSMDAATAVTIRCQRQPPRRRRLSEQRIFVFNARFQWRRCASTTTKTTTCITVAKSTSPARCSLEGSRSRSNGEDAIGRNKKNDFDLIDQKMQRRRRGKGGGRCHERAARFISLLY